MKLPHALVPALILILTVGSIQFATALDQASLAGNWRFENLRSAGMLQKRFIDGLPDFFFDSEFLTEQGDVTINSVGTVSGAVSGTAIFTQSKGVSLKVDGDTIPMMINPAGDVMMRAHSSPGDGQDFLVIVKRPVSTVTSDLAGRWRYVSFGMPDDFTKTFVNSTTGQPRSSTSSSEPPGANDRVVDIFYQGSFYRDVGEVILDASGNVSGDATGTASTSANGTVTLNFGGEVEVFYVNASKNFMIRTRTNSVDHEQDITVLVKAPALNPTLADLAGPWRYTAFQIPIRMSEVFFNYNTNQTRTSFDTTSTSGPDEGFTDAFFPGTFKTESGIIGISEAGGVTGGVSGTAGIDGSGVVTISTGGEAITLFPSADGSVLWGLLEPGSDEDVLISLERVALEPMEIVLEVQDGIPNLLWLGGGNLKMQQSSALSGWLDIDGSTGQSAYQGSSPVTRQFFRLTEVP